MKKNNPEAELAIEAIKYFESKGYLTYKEVSLCGGGTIRSDIYCKNDNESIAIEIKMNMCLKVIEQAFKWREHSNKVYIIVPYKSRQNQFAEEICRDYGIGLLYISKSNIIEKIKPSLTKNPKEPTLYKEQLDSEASNNRGDFITPFKLTVIEIMNYIKEDNHLLSDVIKNIKHHYSTDDSAIGSIKKMIKIGVIDVNLTKEKNKYWIKKHKI